MQFVLSSFSCLNIEIAYSNFTFCGASTPSFFEFTWKMSKFQENEHTPVFGSSVALLISTMEPFTRKFPRYIREGGTTTIQHPKSTVFSHDAHSLQYGHICIVKGLRIGNFPLN